MRKEKNIEKWSAKPGNKSVSVKRKNSEEKKRKREKRKRERDREKEREASIFAHFRTIKF